MATLFISEHEDSNQSSMTGIISAGVLTAHITSITATASLSSAFNTSTRVIRVHTDTTCSVVFGVAPTATVSSPRMATGQTEYRFVPSGTTTQFHVSVIANS